MNMLCEISELELFIKTTADYLLLVMWELLAHQVNIYFFLILMTIFQTILYQTLLKSHNHIIGLII